MNLLKRPPLFKGVSLSFRQCRRLSGFTLVEVMITIVIFAIFMIAFSAIFPSMIRGTSHASSYLQASSLARHKIEQIRQVGYTHLIGSDLKTLGIIDSATPNADGSFSFTTVDGLVNVGTTAGYFGASANAKGVIFIGRALPAQGTSAPALTAAKQVTVTITWTGGGTNNGNYTTQTVIVAP